LSPAVSLSKEHPLTIPESLFLIAGRGRYPSLLIESARASGVKKISVAAFEGETPASTSASADEVHWLRVGQLGKLLEAARKSGARHAMMAGQLAPANLFNLRPDVRALILLAKLRRRNAETLFGEVANQLANVGLELLNAMTFLDDHVARAGHLAGPRLRSRDLEDIHFGFDIAKEVSRLDIGQAVVVKAGTVLAVEAFEGTNECMRRGGNLGRKDAILVKVAKPDQDMRFDVPVIGETTIEVAREAKLKVIACEAGCTLLLDSPAVCRAAAQAGVTLYGIAK
jgi:DUF1009 family protein